MNFPRQGDLIYLDSEPHRGKEEGGHDPENGNIRRPFVVLSNDSYNRKMGMVVAMPITSKKHLDARLYLPILDLVSGINGSVITMQIPNYDYLARHGEIVGRVHISTLNTLKKRAQYIFEACPS